MNNFFSNNVDYNLFKKALRSTYNEPVVINIMSDDSSLEKPVVETVKVVEVKQEEVKPIIKEEKKEEVKPVVKEEKKPTTTTFNIGDNVHHKVFGDGMVLNVRKMGNDSLLEIAFESVGTKKIMANFSGITKN